jgi:predicted metal-dependent peptidase
MLKNIKNYYPLLFLNENDSAAAQVTKIEDLDEVTAGDGTVIDMKHLMSEMEFCKTAIVSQSPLFAPFVHSFVPIYTWLVDTMATDGVRLFVNPKFANDLDWEQKIFVIIHEIMHCVLLHMMRGKGYDHELFNIAGDLEINPIIVDTIKDFDVDFIKKLKGLYEEKYLNVPAETIYKDLLKNNPYPPVISINVGPPPPPGPKPPPPPQPPGPKQKGKLVLNVGARVRIKATGEKGVVTAVNPDGTFEVDPVNESLKLKNKDFYTKLILESFKRDELIPILPAGSGGSGNGNIEIDDEYETEAGGKSEGEGEGEKEGKPGEGKGQGQQKKSEKDQPGGGEGGDETKPQIKKAQDMPGGNSNDPIKKQIDKCDTGRTGSVIDETLGKEIAKKSGYSEQESGKDARASEIWEQNSRQMLERIEKTPEYGSGKGKRLVDLLARIHRGAVDWKSVLKRFVARALSPEKEQRLGNKKYLWNPDYIKYGERSKFNAINKIIVAVDVSGSMSQDTVLTIINEINNIIFSKKVREIQVIFFDDGVDEKSVQKIKNKGSKPWIPKDVDSGGGTNFQKVLDWVHDNLKNRVTLMVFFTDGGAEMPKKPPYANKFIWMVYDNPRFSQPFGKIIHLQTEGRA